MRGLTLGAYSNWSPIAVSFTGECIDGNLKFHMHVNSGLRREWSILLGPTVGSYSGG